MILVGRGLHVVLLEMLADIVIQAHSSLFLGMQRSLGAGAGGVKATEDSK